MTGIILDSLLMMLLVAAIGYGIKLERKLKALREGQLAFAGAVKELNNAAGRAEQALATLRASGAETDLLHDRIIKARQVKQELETLMARAAKQTPVAAKPLAQPTEEEPLELVSTMALINDETERARRMASLMQRIEQANAAVPPLEPKPAPQKPAQDRLSGMLQAIAANQAAQQSLNRARRSLDEDLFAA
ncbi:DUF6468 domain-containing protein [uncultured Brevundimonas sp.]|uniref:DUF6468 domain-containing protein n=1 Tax=uncultured Brevundimonas sp. TaxID=213418 RepID=UPI0026041112|nr:DUF6468 domain-containing protein [uncultured Brevundimonas sp.]